MAEATAVQLKKSDFESDQDVRWCPGCGDYSILAAVQRFLPTLGEPLHKYVFVSGIGCSSRFPYYMDTYGFHTIHGRAPAVATGVKVANPELSVWMVTGDGDALSIGGNHIIHLLRRNLDINVLLFNNQIYGLTKGQYSPTSEQGKVTKSTPMGSPDTPLSPVQIALGAQATFVARTLDVDAKHMMSVFEAANNHRGTSFIEIYQNCNIFNDGAFDDIRERAVRDDAQIKLADGEPMIFGKEKNKGLKVDGAQIEVVSFDAEDPDGPSKAGVSPFDASNRSLAKLLGSLPWPPSYPLPMGVLFQEERETFEVSMNDMVRKAQEKQPLKGDTDEVLTDLFHSGETWVVS